MSRKDRGWKIPCSKVFRSSPECEALMDSLRRGRRRSALCATQGEINCMSDPTLDLNRAIPTLALEGWRLRPKSGQAYASSTTLMYVVLFRYGRPFRWILASRCSLSPYGNIEWAHGDLQRLYGDLQRLEFPALFRAHSHPLHNWEGVGWGADIVWNAWIVSVLYVLKAILQDAGLGQPSCLAVF